MNKSDQINELAAALCAVQLELRPAHKDSTNPHFKSRYADLESCWDAIREVAPKHGLCVIQTMDEISGGVVIETLLAHKSGQFISGRLQLTPQRNDAQGIGSCITYGRRYSLAAIVGLTQTDDDAEGDVRQPAKASPYSEQGKQEAATQPKAKPAEAGYKPKVLPPLDTLDPKKEIKPDTKEANVARAKLFQGIAELIAMEGSSDSTVLEIIKENSADIDPGTKALSELEDSVLQKIIDHWDFVARQISEKRLKSNTAYNTAKRNERK